MYQDEEPSLPPKALFLKVILPQLELVMTEQFLQETEYRAETLLRHEWRSLESLYFTNNALDYMETSEEEELSDGWMAVKAFKNILFEREVEEEEVQEVRSDLYIYTYIYICLYIYKKICMIRYIVFVLYL